MIKEPEEPDYMVELRDREERQNHIWERLAQAMDAVKYGRFGDAARDFHGAYSLAMGYSKDYGGPPKWFLNHEPSWARSLKKMIPMCRELKNQLARLERQNKSIEKKLDWIIKNQPRSR